MKVGDVIITKKGKRQLPCHANQIGVIIGIIDDNRCSDPIKVRLQNEQDTFLSKDELSIIIPSPQIEIFNYLMSR